jgi:hypothetical protein
MQALETYVANILLQVTKSSDGWAIGILGVKASEYLERLIYRLWVLMWSVSHDGSFFKKGMFGVKASE